MTNIGADNCRRSQSRLRIHIGAIKIDLATMLMNNIADKFYLFLKNSISAGVSNHCARKIFTVLRGLLFKIGHVNVTIFQGLYHNYLHPGHHG